MCFIIVHRATLLYYIAYSLLPPQLSVWPTVVEFGIEIVQKIITCVSIEYRDLAETIESGPLCVTDLFMNKSVAYFLFITAFI